jgi:tetratricopeptide (TPR) repeat protein
MHKRFPLPLLSLKIAPIIALLLICNNDAVAATFSRSAPWVGETLWGAPCEGGGQGFGPFDYTQRAQYSRQLMEVEGAHFPPQVENLISGKRGSLMGDLDYTLRAWPNHHRALNSVIRYRLRNKEGIVKTNETPAECYLQRAVNYSPKDGISQMLYGILLQQMGHPQDALKAYQQAERLEPNNLQVKYNMGLLLVELKQYEEAKEYATEVYSMNFPLPGLMRKLKEQGYWKGDPP